MKKALLGTTALIAAVFGSQAARADDQPVKLSISGLAQFAYGVAVSEKMHNPGGGTGNTVASTNLPDGMKTYAVVDLSGDSKFKNGITAGAFIEFAAQPQATGSLKNGGTTQVKQDWIHLMGDSFGELRMGDYTDARRAKGMAAPSWSPNFLLNANSPDIAFIGSGAFTNTTTAWFGNRYMTEVAYFSPTFDGAQLALSYAPDSGAFSSAGPGNVVISSNGTYLIGNTAIRDVFSAALTWGGIVDGFSINTDAGITTGSAKKTAPGTPPNSNPFVWDAGFSVGYGPWLAGATYEQTSNLLTNFGYGLDNEAIHKTLDVGLTYTVGNLTTGVEWSRGIYERGQGLDFAGTPLPAGADPKAHFTLDTVTPGASYVIGPGVDIDAGIAYNVAHGAGLDAGATTARGQEIVFEFGSEVKF